jgi:Flp pilus assembly protein TadG
MNTLRAARRTGRGTGRATGRDQGAAAVEFALLLPILLLVLFGIIDFGRALNMQIELTNAAREGVRGLALGTTANPTTATQTAAQPLTGVSVAYSGCSGNTNANVTASKTFTYVTPISPILNLLGFSSLAVPTIQGKAQMRCGG